MSESKLDAVMDILLRTTNKFIAAVPYLVIGAVVIMAILAIAGLMPIPYTSSSYADKTLPTPEPLDCHAVKVPGYPRDHHLCKMPGGGQCLFYDAGTTPVCYEGETK